MLKAHIYTRSGNVQIGLWKYRWKERELDGRRAYRAGAPWFCIKAKNVPHYVELEHDICSDDQSYDPDEMLYGRFLYFAQVETAWNAGPGAIDQPLIFGHCRLFHRFKLDAASRWHTVSLQLISPSSIS